MMPASSGSQLGVASMELPLETMCFTRPIVSMTTICDDVAAQPARRDDESPRMRPARLGPLLVEAAGRDRRDRLAIGRNAHEMRGARHDLHGDDLAVGAARRDWSSRWSKVIRRWRPPRCTQRSERC